MRKVAPDCGLGIDGLSAVQYKDEQATGMNIGREVREAAARNADVRT